MYRLGRLQADVLKAQAEFSKPRATSAEPRLGT